ncbi:MAG: hypothetical protein LC643_04675, partial [Bacteroidales bacterium]|nr:hypothetical protein [Bacteroidales bacterium]
MHKIIAFVVLLFCLSPVVAQNGSHTVTHTINWTQKESSTMLPFDGEGHWQNGLPISRFSTPLPFHVVPGSISVDIIDATWNEDLLFKTDRNLADSATISLSYQTKALKSSSGTNQINNSALASGQWTKIAINTTGIYRIPYSTLQSWGYSQPASVSVFGFGGQMVPRVNSDERPDDLPQVGVWHYNDAIYFYGHGPATWRWDANKSMFLHQIHFWSDQAYYFISDTQGTTKIIDPLETITGDATQNVTHFDFRIFHEKELKNLIESGRKWFGETFEPGMKTEHNFSFSLPNRDQAAPVQLLAAVAGRSEIVNSFHFSVNNQSTPSLTLNVPPLNMNSYDNFFAQEQSGNNSFVVAGNDLEIKVRYTDQSSNAKGWLDYITINSRNALQLTGHELHFRDTQSVGAGQIALFNIVNASASTMVWDVTDITTPRKASVNYSGSSLTFKAKTDQLREFVAFNPGGQFPVPDRLETVANQNLHAISQAHYVIVAPDQFRSQAQDLANLHLKHHNLNSVIVSPT